MRRRRLKADGPAEPWARHILALATRILAANSATNGQDVAQCGRHALEKAYDRLLEASVGDEGPADESAVNLPALSPQILGQSYERILDYLATRSNGQVRFVLASGQRRKTGSYFTPSSLIKPLIDAALLARLEDRWRAALPRIADHIDTLSFLPDIGEWTRSERDRAMEELLALRVCDPACGPGPFLLAAGEALAERLAWLRHGTRNPDKAERNSARQAVLPCLHGADTDRLAVRIARHSLWLWSGRPGRTAEEVPSQLVVGDSLGIGIGADEKIDPVDWREIWLEIFGGCDPGFDVILSNPPFANAIERATPDAIKARLSANYEEIGGTADLSFYFVALADRIACQNGTIGMVLPRGFLSGRAARRLRQRLLRTRPPKLMDAPGSQSLFTGADVYVIGLALGPGEGCRIRRDGAVLVEKIATVDQDNWWAPFCRPIAPVLERSTARSSFEVFASMTTGMAYHLVPYLDEGDPLSTHKLVTTGLIDQQVCHWGKRRCRYLRRDYHRPIVRPSTQMPADLVRRLERVRRPKILVAGLSNQVEAFLDEKGEYCGAVSTYTILHPTDDSTALASLCDWLNHPDATERLRAELGAHALSGGRITLTKEFLRGLVFLAGAGT